MLNTPKILTVSQLNFYIKSLLDNDQRLSYVFLEGEISNLTDHYSSGHIYFSLKDEKSVIKAVMFSYAAKNLKFKPKNGMKVLLRGRITVYEPSGQCQLYVEDMQPDGIGALSLQFEQLKQKLQKEGLFDNSHKKPLPTYPETIGVITSPTGAAVRDILNILSRRYPCCDVVMYPVLVQGENAPKQLTQAVNTFSSTGVADVIIIGRGGGSAEDLWAFNDEDLARAIYNCKTPVISAVGHETDFSISDFVADLRAPTPSAAAELAVPDSSELLVSIAQNKQYISSIINTKLTSLSHSLDNSYRLLKAYSPENKIDSQLESINLIAEKLSSISSAVIENATQSFIKTASKLESLNPVSVLKRGYSYVTKEDGTTVSTVAGVLPNDKINIKVSDGVIKAQVID